MRKKTEMGKPENENAASYCCDNDFAKCQF